MKIFAIGEALLELQKHQNNDIILNVGGDSLNFAVYASRLNQKKHFIGYATQLGSDSLTPIIHQLLDDEHINQQAIIVDTQKSSGLYAIDNKDNGEKIFSYWRDNSPATVMFDGKAGDQLLQILATGDVFYFTGISLAILQSPSLEKFLKFIKIARQQGKIIIFDTNYRVKLWQSAQQCQDVFAQIFPYCTHLLPSTEDFKDIYDIDVMQMRDMLSQYNNCEIIIKNAEKSLYSYDGAWQEHGLEKLDDMLDSTAAGDSFNAAYIMARLNKKTIFDSIALGQQLARTVISHKGAIIDKKYTENIQI